MIDALGIDRNKGVAHVFAFKEGGERHARRQARGHVLARMDADIDAAGEQGFVDFLGENALATDG